VITVIDTEHLDDFVSRLEELRYFGGTGNNEDYYNGYQAAVTDVLDGLQQLFVKPRIRDSKRLEPYARAVLAVKDA
jgi:hypothetical protein